jgi:protein phosphatase
VELRWGAATDVGRRRAQNEDAFLTAPSVFAVADGMGGHQRGEVAAAIAVRSLATLPDAPAARSIVMDAIRLADDAIVDYSRQHATGPMGTTLCGLAVTADGPTAALVAFNVGDSRCYRASGGRLVQVSHDHSVVQELIDAGALAATDAERHPERHVVTRSLGAGDALEIDWWHIDPVEGDRFLLCSDGLVKEVPIDVIGAELARGDDPQQTAQRLVDRAVAAGGRDNVTAVIVDIDVADGPGGHLDEETNPRGESAPGVDDITNPLPHRA